MDEQIAQNEQIKKTYDDTFNALREHDGALAEYDRDLNVYNSDLAAYEADNNNYLARLNDYGARCLSGQLDEGSYNACVAEQGGLNAEYNGLEPRRLELDGRHADLEVRSSTLTSKVQPLRADLDNYAQMMKRIFAEWEENKRKFDQVSGELEGLRSQLANFCGSVEQIQNTDEDALEALKHCSSLGWDGTRKRLPSVQFWIEQASAGGWGGLTVNPNQ